MTTPNTSGPTSEKTVLEDVAQMLHSTPEEVLGMLEAIERGESRAEYFGFSDEILRSIETIALAYYRGQRYAEAHTVFEMLAILSEGTWAAAWRGLGACAQAQDDHAQAIDYFRRAIAQNSDDAHSAVYLGECLCLTGEVEAGLEVLKAVLARNDAINSLGPGSGQKDAPHLIRAQAIVQAGDTTHAPKKAARAASDAVTAPPEFAAQEIGPSDVDVEDILKGLTAQQAVSDPEVQALLDEPETRAQLDELAQAVRTGAMTIRRIADFSQEQMDAGYSIACQLLERGEAVKAVQIAGWMLYIDSQDTRFHRLLGLCMHHLKFYALADYYYTLVGIWRPGGADAATLMYHGEIKLMLEEREQGLSMLQRGVAAAGTDVALKDVVKRGRLLLKQLAKSGL